MARFPFLNADGTFQSAQVKAQLDARTDTRMRNQLPTLADELGIGGSGSGIEEVSGTVVLDSSGPAVREFFTTGATTFKANGADTLLSSFTAVVWRRNSQGSWGYQVVQDSWTTPAPTPDTTAPVAGTLGVTVTDVKADLSVSGASDNRGYVQYSFSKDNGSTWTSYQDAAAYSFTGLTAATPYTFRHRVKDAAGNVATGTTVSKTTAAAPSALADSIKALAPVGYWKLNETSGTVAADSSGNARNGTYSGAVNSVDGFATGMSVTIPDDDSFSPADSTAGFTVFGIIRPGSVSQRGYIAAKGASGNYEWWMRNSAGYLEFTASTAAGDPLTEFKTDGAVITAGAWSAVAATIPQPVSGAMAELFLNGNTPLPATKLKSVSGTSVNGTAPVTIGRRGDGDAPSWPSLTIGHVAIFRKKLTTAEIGALMTAARKDGLIV